jgi:hypothetical protein
MIRLLAILLLLVRTGGMLMAHPVAQGSLEIDVCADHVAVRARVSNEQVFVAGAFEKVSQPAADLEGLFRQHAEYLLKHIQLLGRGRILGGKVERVVVPEDRTTNGFASYEFRHEFSGEPPRKLLVREDVMQDVEFAPGIRWTASFLVSQRWNGNLIREGVLLTPSAEVELVFDTTNEPALNRWALFGSYLRHGIAHILAGWDHLLFVAALVLAVMSLWDLVKVVTAFTIAHTLTLALSAFGVARLPPSVVEPMIALSIIVVALQNVIFPRSARGSSRLLLAFALGLFHGLGFAGGLIEAMHGMGPAATTVALAGFSIGVEVGHQAVVIPLFMGARLMRRRPTDSSAPVATPLLRCASIAIALAGCIYFTLALRG